MTWFEELVFSKEVDYATDTQMRRWRMSRKLRSESRQLQWDIPGAPWHVMLCTVDEAKQLCYRHENAELPTIDDARKVTRTVQSFKTKGEAVEKAREIAAAKNLHLVLDHMTSDVARFRHIGDDNGGLHLWIVQFGAEGSY